jgi:sugar phosphate isomerase/epimerase
MNAKDSIYISTVAFAKQDINHILELAILHNLNIEFSSGLPYNKNNEHLFLRAPIKKLVHNYFPAPENPFVINLASSNESIRKKSIDMCCHGLELAKNTNSPHYSAHAGFCIDPDPHQLGEQLSVNATIDREKHWKLFISSIKEILKKAETLNTLFFIENNVIASFNLTASQESPLLCCSSFELMELYYTIEHKLFGVLLDTAHLKVSCQTLGLDKIEEFNKIMPVVKALHHSDNDGTKDTNNPINEFYWCKNLLENFKTKINVLEVKNLTVEEMKCQINLLYKFLNND